MRVNLRNIRCPPNALGNFLGYFKEGKDLREGPTSYKSIHVRSKFVGLFFLFHKDVVEPSFHFRCGENNKVSGLSTKVTIYI
jgi:hypothetical protein